MVDSLEMLGGMEPQPGREAKIPGLTPGNGKGAGSEERGQVLSPVCPANTAILPFAASCAGQDCCSPPGSRLPGSQGSVRTQGPSPELMLLPPPGMPSASAARGTPGHPSKPQLRGLHIHAAFLGSTPALLWATSGFATLTWLHCNGFVCLPPSGTWPQGQRLDVSHSSLCPQCVRSACSVCVTAGRTLQAAVSNLLGLLASGWGQPKGGDQRAGEGEPKVPLVHSGPKQCLWLQCFWHFQLPSAGPSLSVRDPTWQFCFLLCPSSLGDVQQLPAVIELWVTLPSSV